MSDLDLNKTSNSTQNRDTGSSKDLKEQMADAGAELKQRAGDAFQASADIARDKFSEAAEAAKNVAGGTVDQIQSQAREQQRSGADFVERLAGNIRDAGRAFEKDVPFAARGINSAADYVEDAAQKIRNGSVRNLFEGTTDFAKRQPAAFLGLSVLAGFAAVRFLKASGGDSPSPERRNTADWSSPEGRPAWSGTSSATGGEAWQQGSRQPGASREQASSPQGSKVS